MQYAAQVCLRSLPFLCLSVRYYNCVPFAGCVFVGPSKICQPRVKTFEELPLEMHPQKPPQVSFLSSYQLSENVNWLVTFSESFFRLRHYHLCLLLKMVVLGRDRCSTCVNLCLFSLGQPDGQRDGSGLRRIWENWAQPWGCCLEKVKWYESKNLNICENWNRSTRRTQPAV